MSKRVTLFDPPEQDHSKALIENVLDLTPVVDLGPVQYPSLLYREELYSNKCFFVSRMSSPIPARYGIPPELEASTAVPRSHSPYQQPCGRSRPTTPSTACTATSYLRAIPRSPFYTTSSVYGTGGASLPEPCRHDNGDDRSSPPR